MATLSAVRHDRILKEFYTRLLTAGKKSLVARLIPLFSLRNERRSLICLEIETIGT